jgi:hypothetical protein
MGPHTGAGQTSSHDGVDEHLLVEVPLCQVEAFAETVWFRKEPCEKAWQVVEPGAGKVREGHYIRDVRDPVVIMSANAHPRTQANQTGLVIRDEFGTEHMVFWRRVRSYQVIPDPGMALRIDLRFVIEDETSLPG